MASVELYEAVAAEPVAWPASELVDRLAAATLAGQPRLSGTRLVCVDGPAGSGKTSLAAALAAELTARGRRVRTVPMDDLYEGWDGAPAGVVMLREQILTPLATGRPGRYTRYDWHRGRYAEVHEVPTGLDVLIVEGVLSADRLVEPLPSVRVFVEAPTTQRLERGIARDGERLRDRWLEWMRWEREYFAGSDTRARADLVVDGSAPAGTR